MSYERRVRIGNAALAALTVGLFVYIAIWERHGLSSGELDDRRAQLVPAFVRERVSEVSIDREGGRIVLVRERAEEEGELGEWTLKEPVEGAADFDAVDSLLGAIEWATPLRRLEGISAADRERFGLDHPALSGSFTVADRHVSLRFGREGPQGDGRYFQMDDPSVAFVVGEDLYEALDHDAAHFRGKELFADFGTTAATALAIARRGAPRIRVEKRDGRFHAVAPFEGLASDGVVRGALRALSDLAATRFVDDDPSELQRYGLDAPSLDVRVELAPSDGGRTRSRRLRIGNACEVGEGAEPEVHARVGDGPVVCIAAAALEALSIEPEAIREPRLVTTEDDAVERVEIARGRDRIVLTRGDEGFTMDAEGEGEGALVDDDALASFLGDLRGVRATAFYPADDAAIRTRGLATPAVRIEIQRSDDGPAEEIAIGRPAGGGLFARRGDEPVILELPGGPLAALDVTRVSFRSRGLVDDDVELAVSLSIRRGAVEETIAREGDAYRVTAPIAAAADRAEVRDTLRELAALSAERFVAEAPLPPHGLTTPRIVARVRFEGESAEHDHEDEDENEEGERPSGPREHTLRIGAEAEGGAFAQLDSDRAVFVVPATVVETLSSPLVDRAALATDLPELATVVIERGAERLSLRKEGGTLVATDGTPVDPDRARAILDRLSTLRATDVAGYGAAPVAAGLAAPRARVTVTRIDGAPEPHEYVILFGSPTTDASDRPRVHARRADLDVTFLVSDDAAAPFVGN